MRHATWRGVSTQSRCCAGNAPKKKVYERSEALVRILSAEKRDAKRKHTTQLFWQWKKRASEQARERSKQIEGWRKKHGLPYPILCTEHASIAVWSWANATIHRELDSVKGTEGRSRSRSWGREREPTRPVYYNLSRLTIAIVPAPILTFEHRGRERERKDERELD